MFIVSNGGPIGAIRRVVWRPLAACAFVACIVTVFGGCTSSAKGNPPAATTTTTTTKTTTKRHVIQKSNAVAASATTTITSATAHDAPSYVSCPSGMYANPSDYSVCLPFPAPTEESFVGTWHVHGSELEINSNGTAVSHDNCGGAVCDEEDRLAVVLSPNRKRLTATITAISFTNGVGKEDRRPFPERRASRRRLVLLSVRGAASHEGNDHPLLAACHRPPQRQPLLVRRRPRGSVPVLLRGVARATSRRGLHPAVGQSV